MTGGVCAAAFSASGTVLSSAFKIAETIVINTNTVEKSIRSARLETLCNMIHFLCQALSISLRLLQIRIRH
jgi:hypothetical protein